MTRPRGCRAGRPPESPSPAPGDPSDDTTVLEAHPRRAAPLSTAQAQTVLWVSNTGRARRALGVVFVACAALLGADAAHAECTFWSAELYSEDDQGGIFGYYRSGQFDIGSLLVGGEPADKFSYAATEYTLNRLDRNDSSSIQLTLGFTSLGGDLAEQAVRDNIELRTGIGNPEKTFNLGSASRSNDELGWSNSGVTWGDDVLYNVSLVQSGPCQPGSFAATGGVGTVTLSWGAVTSSDGTAVTGYEYRYKTDGDYGAWTEIPNSANLTSYEVGNLGVGDHSFQLRGRSSANPGVHTAAVTATVEADTTPPALESATVEPVGVLVQMNFSEDLDAGNTPPASALALTADGEPVAIGMVGLGLLDNEFVLDGLDPTILMGQTVVVTYTDPTASDDAEALQDAAGNDVASFTTGSDGVPAVVNNSTVAAPGAPQNVVAAAFTGRVTLDWDAPASDGGSPITHYEYRLQRGTGSFGDWELAETTNSSHELGDDGTSLVFRYVYIRTDETFTYEVRAVSASGPGAGAAADAILTAPEASMRVEAAEVRVSEGVGTGTVNAVLEIPDGWGPYDRDGDLDFTFTSTGVTATPSEDYPSVSAELFFGAGDFMEVDGRWIATTGVEFEIVDDRLDENDESFTLTLQISSTTPPWLPNPSSNNITTIHHRGQRRAAVVGDGGAG